MRKPKSLSSIFTILCLSLIVSSCSIVEKIHFFSSKNSDINTNEYIDTTNDIIIEENTFQEDSIINDEYYFEEEIIAYDTTDLIVADSLEIALQERLDSENSGEAIVDEADVMMTTH